MKPKAVLTARVPAHVRAMLEDALDLQVYEGPARMPRDQLAELLKDAEGVLCSVSTPLENELLDALPNLKAICNSAVGYDNVDIPHATERSILVCNTPGVLSDAVADLTICMIIAMARGVFEADRFAKEGRWSRGETLPLGRDLPDSTLGILGFGRIGHVIAQRAQAFGMRRIYYDPVRDSDAEKNGLADYRERDDVFREADFLTVHMFLDASTRRSIGAREFGLMKRTAYFVNTARGGLVDQPALTVALQRGTIAGAGLDVLEKEPPNEEDEIFNAPNTIIVPHIGSAATGTRQAMAELAARNLIAVLTGGTPETMVNPEALQAQRA